MKVLDLEISPKNITQNSGKIPVKLNPIIPILSPSGDVSEIVSAIEQVNGSAGFRRFLVAGPGLGVRLKGFPDSDVYREIGRQICEVKSLLANKEIQVGWWCSPTLKSGEGPYQRVVGIDGAVAKVSSCPLDPDFMEVFSSNVALVAEIANPFLIQFEDDFELSNHTGVSFGCFCPLHMAEFARRMGREYIREELMGIFSQVNDESIFLRRKWAEMIRDSLVGLADRVREKIDAVDPTIRTSLCQPGCSDMDGYMTEAVAEAFAGNTRPMVRLHGATYSCDNPWNIPPAIFHAHCSKENLPKHFELIHESDTWPHIRYFMSAAKLKSFLAAAFSYGLDDSLFYGTQYLDDPLEDTGYCDMFQAETVRFETLKKELLDCSPAGCEICSSPDTHAVIPYTLGQGYSCGDVINPWVAVLGRMGIPYSIRPGKVKMLAGDYAKLLTDEEVMQLLSSPVMLDGRAALILSKRGFGDMIGGDVFAGNKDIIPCYEIINDAANVRGSKGKLMPNRFAFPAGSEGGSFVEIFVKDDTEILSTLLDYDLNELLPGMTYCENSLGGKISITAIDLEAQQSSAIFNYRRKQLIVQTLLRMNRESLSVYVRSLPNVFCIYNESESKDKAILTIMNLSSDTSLGIELVLSEHWEKGHLEYLDYNGSWITIDVAAKNGSVVLPIELKLMLPIYLKIS